MLRRLAAYIDQNKNISRNQIGFMKGSRTSDHIFLLQTIIEKVVKKACQQKLFCAFIDFEKAYDTVNRRTLLGRLNDIGINGLFFKNVVSMYQKTDYLVKYEEGHLDAIESNIGLKQGCPLSPLLFNLYIDDISNIFDKHCEPISIQGESISHLLYADDLILVSKSKEGLQRCLDKLQVFADLKHLKVNIDKSKTMIFNKIGKLIKHYFRINGKQLEPVHNFCYLGFDICASGTVNTAINTLHDKAMKAMRPIFGAISKFNLPVKTAIHVFHTIISPIMLYNVENWLTLSNKKLEKITLDNIFTELNDTKANMIHRKFLKYVLGVTKSCPTLALMGETAEIPIIVKGLRLMLKFWHRLNHLNNESLAKKSTFGKYRAANKLDSDN